MTKTERRLLSEIAHEAHMMGRVYSNMGEVETPGEVYRNIENFIDKILCDSKTRKRIKARHKRLRKKR